MTQDAVDQALNVADEAVEKQRNEIKAELFRLIEAVDEGTFRGAIVTTFDPKRGTNTLKMWGDKTIVHQSAVRVLEQAGLIHFGGQ